ncbi:S-layer homology domain-containing protein [Thermaerobacter sp. FW80]|uniref:S-layer homology domain-containing protein n=1 Tax=Thermaerobacter sp. FW80 TaxID=2546351 RepID=UPI0014320AED|nr:S-layer homology domain-containing protein [Thermaerobacter sp. FW80]
MAGIVVTALVVAILASHVSYVQASHGEFPDVDGVLTGDILKAHDVGLVDGFPDGTFRPGARVTRAAFAKMLVLAVERATGTELPLGREFFLDVTEGQKLYEYVVKAYNAGFILGYTDGTFGYDKNITRKEAAVIIQRALNLAPASEPFDDVPADSWFADAVGAVARANIMKGYDDFVWRYFRPDMELTRGQAAAVAYRAYSFKRNEVNPPLGSPKNPAPIGTEFPVGDKWMVKILSIDPDAWPEISEESMFNDPPDPGYQYVMARVRVTYVGTDSSGSFIDVHFDYLDANSVRATDSCGVIPDPLLGGFETILPGYAKEGNVCWSVASDAVRGGIIAVSSFWDGPRVYFEGVR